MDRFSILIIILAITMVAMLFYVLEDGEKNREGYKLVSCINRAIGSGIDSNTAEFICKDNN